MRTMNRIWARRGSSLTALVSSILFGAITAGSGGSIQLVPSGAVWKFYDKGTDLGTAWRSPTYDDTAWASGPAQLGYGDGDEATITSYGPNSSTKFITTYFRHTFSVGDPAALSGVSLEVLRDDGAVAYLNGTQIASYSMPGTFDYRTYATTASEFTWEPPLSVPVSLLVPGDNVIAVEVHQGNASSTDLTLDLRLTAAIDLRVALDAPANGATGVPVPATLTATPTHPSGQPTTVAFYGRPAPEPAPDFSIVVLPDIQNYTAQVNGGSIAILESQIQFILDNQQASNVVYVTQLGDVSNNGDWYEAEWLNATEALYRLETPVPPNAEIPYGAAVGNHDQMVPAGDTSPTTFYNQYFGVSHFQGRSYYGGHFGANNNNHYDLFSASGLDFIVIYLEFDTAPDLPVLDWADSLLKDNPGRRGIVVTHYLLETSAAWGAQGRAIYDALKDNPNLFLMLCGHNAGEARRTDVYTGNTVHTLLADYQAYAAGGNGFLRVLHFSPGRNAIYVRTYSPWTKQYETDAASEFSLPYQMNTGPAFTPIQQSTVVASGTPATATWSGLLPGTRYQWFAEASDGVQTAMSEVWDFTTSVTAPPSVTLSAPTEGQTFAVAPAEVTLTATATDSDGTVARVEFFAGSTSLGSDLEAPYELATTLATGAHILTAVATDNAGAQTVSAPVHVTVGTAPAAPGGLVAAPQSRTSVVLNWADNSDNEDGFGIYQSGDGVSYTLIGTLSADASSTIVTGLAPGTTYYFLVRAFNALGYADSAPATVTTTANGAPLAGADLFNASEDAILSVAAPGVLANDTDPDNDLLSAVVVTGPAYGALTLRPDGSFDYSPALNFSGSDAFTYAASDGNAVSAPTTVTINVGPINDTPVANPDTATTLEGAGVVINVLANDIDPEGSGLAVIAVTPGASGNVTLNANQTITYRPASGFTGQDTFTYTVTDGAATAAGSVTVTVRPNVLFSEGFESGNFTAGGWTIAGTPSIDVAAKYSGTYGALLKKTSTITKVISGIAATTVKLSYARRVSGLDAGETGVIEVSPDGATWEPLETLSGTAAWEIKTSDLSLTSSALWLRFRLNADAGNDMFMVDDVVISGGSPANTAPTTLVDAYALDEDTTLAVPAAGLLANDVDSDGDPLSAVLAAGPAHGTLTLNADGSFSYAPDLNFTGVDTFSYRADDGLAQSDLTTVSITVRPLNDAPVGAADTYSIDQDSRLDVAAPGLLGNDTDVDGDALTVVSASSPASGALTFSANGWFTYTPAAGFFGDDSFQYTLADGQGGTATAIATVKVLRLNHAPVALDDSYTVTEDSSVSVVAPGVLANDSDSDGNTVNAVLVTSATHGTLTLNPDGSFAYMPRANFSGTDSFTYKATDGTAASPSATVTITVTEVNDAPTAQDGSLTIGEDGVATVTLNVTDPDGDALTFDIAQPAHGTLLLDGSSVTYTPTANFYGADAFTFQARDSSGAPSEVATISITVLPVNDAPVAADASASTSEDGSAALTLTASDVDGDPVLFEIATPPAHGTISGTLPAVTYTPGANYYGPDQFTFSATDGQGGTGTAVVSINVAPVNDAPVATADFYTVSQGTALEISALAGVLANDNDIDSTALTARLVSGAWPEHGTLALNTDGSFGYTPAAGFEGTDTFQYEVVDEAGAESTALVTITIQRANTAPVSTGDTYSTAEDTRLEITPGVLANDTDADRDPLTAALVNGPVNGTLVFSPNGSFSYTPNANFNGTDSFTYRASDGLAYGDAATVTINIAAVNDLPVAGLDSYTTAQDAVLTAPAASGVLANDSDIDSAFITAAVLAGPANGTLALAADGSFTYTPNPAFAGTDTFTYTVTDADGGTATATASIVVQRPSTTMHVASISVTTIDAGKGKKRGQAEVIIVDAAGNPVANALVTGAFSEAINEARSATTDGSGKALLQTVATARAPQLTFTVTNVSRSGWNYDPSANVETSDRNY